MVDYALIAMMILPILACIVLKVLFTPAGDGGVHIAGAMVFWGDPESSTSPYLSESQVNTWAVMISILGLCLYMTHGDLLIERSHGCRHACGRVAVYQHHVGLHFFQHVAHTD